MDLPAQETLFAPYIRDSIPPEPTAEPYTYSVINRHLALRQNEGDEDSSVSSATCAYYSFADGWQPLRCEDSCATSGSLFGCSNLPTTCHDHTFEGCSDSSTAGLSCCASTYPFCVTGSVTDGGNVFTAFRCGRNTLSGEVDLFANTENTITKTISGDTETIYVTPTADGPGDDTDGGSEGNPGSGSGVNDGGQGGGGDGGSSAPLGAIIGGTIGGVALILLIAFGIWFIRFQKRKKQEMSNMNEAQMDTYRYSGMYQAQDPIASPKPEGYTPVPVEMPVHQDPAELPVDRRT